jgi:hypothetical protein
MTSRFGDGAMGPARKTDGGVCKRV